jgi:predicted TIM-barrel fold metal-dependent hydrolase
VLWASDFPHPDGLWPDSQQFISAMFGNMAPAIRDQIVYGNAAKLYDLE